MRQLNFCTPQALAGVVEDLELSYDVVDGTVNPMDVKTLPYTIQRQHVHREPDSESQRPRGRALGVHVHQAARLPPQSPVHGREPAEPRVRGSVPVGHLRSTMRAEHTSVPFRPRSGTRHRAHRGADDHAADVGADDRLHDGRHERSAIPRHRQGPDARLLRRPVGARAAERGPRQSVSDQRGADDVRRSRRWQPRRRRSRA